MVAGPDHNRLVGVGSVDIFCGVFGGDPVYLYFILKSLDSIDFFSQKQCLYLIINNTSTPGKLTLETVKAFKDDVEAKGAKFYIVHLPGKMHSKGFLENNVLLYSKLLEALEKFTPVIRPEEDMLRKIKKSTLNVLSGRNHYLEELNKIVADAVTKSIT